MKCIQLFYSLQLIQTNSTLSHKQNRKGELGILSNMLCPATNAIWVLNYVEILTYFKTLSIN